MMVALWVYGLAKGVRSAREIQRRCVEDVAFRVLAANLVPGHSTLSRFVRRHQEALAGLFEQVVGFCVRGGLVEAGVVAVDSTELSANASGYANRGYGEIARAIVDEALEVNAAEDERLGERRGDELPAELADGTARRRRLEEIKREMEREWEAERAAQQSMLERRARAAHRAPAGRAPAGGARSVG